MHVTDRHSSLLSSDVRRSAMSDMEQWQIALSAAIDLFSVDDASCCIQLTSLNFCWSFPRAGCSRVYWNLVEIWRSSDKNKLGHFWHTLYLTFSRFIYIYENSGFKVYVLDWAGSLFVSFSNRSNRTSTRWITKSTNKQIKIAIWQIFTVHYVIGGRSFHHRSIRHKTVIYTCNRLQFIVQYNIWQMQLLKGKCVRDCYQ